MAAIVAVTLACIGGGGCDLLGPDDPYLITVQNDTSNAVRVLRCANENCRGSFPDGAVLAPEETTRIGVSTVGVPNPQLVIDAKTGRRLGCLPLVMPEPKSGLVARISQAVTCQDTYDHDRQWPRG